ncbi:reticulon-4 isoform X1 [Grammomys surdaster]|uniref:reticulon-4 isoform X1 n=1 Tax=Grammomys surdaster TaxID=491861 RepID=UPI00109F05D5|nr:reticulon-4 isoform X1 [Grammomys surdaster]
MEDVDQASLVSSSADSPPRPPPAFKYQFITEPEDEEDEEEDEEEEDDDEDLEELEVLERKPAAGLSAAPVPPAAAAPLLDFSSDSVPPAPRGPLPAAPPAAPERQPSWERSPVASLPSLPPAAAVLPSKLPEDDEPPARPPPPPPAGARPLAEPAAPPSTPAAPKRRGSGSMDETLFALPAASEPVIPSSAVVDLLYWRDIKKTGVVFGASLFLLLSLTVFSIVSVTAYIALALLSVTISFRIYKGVIQAIQKSDEGHPFRAYLESEVAVSEELVQKYSNSALGHVNSTVKELRRLFLVDDLVDSLKFAVLMWVFTYVGALFNGLTLLILALISLFSIPVIYERHQAQIDHYLGLANKSVKDAMAKIQAKIPGLKRKAE